MRLTYMSLSFALLVALTTTLHAENPILVKVKTPVGSGTGSIVVILKNKPISDGYEGYILTAYHVVNDSAEKNARDIEIEFPNGRAAKNCKVVASDHKNDISLVWAWIPGDYKEIEISSRIPQPGDAIIFHGLGGGIGVTDEPKIRRISAFASRPTSQNNVYSDIVLIPGDSGGPVTLDDKLVGIISGGWFWFDREIGEVDKETNEKKKQKVTWPASACGLDPIKGLLATIQAPS